MSHLKDLLDSRAPLFKIRTNKSGKVRTELCIEDVYVEHLEVLKELKLITILPYEEEEIYIFKDSYLIPHFNVFYASKITSVKDKYLPELITRLCYLNPGTDDFSLKKITEFILHNFVVKVHAESEILYGKEIMVPAIGYQKMRNMVQAIAGSSMIRDYKPDTERYIMYSRMSRLTREAKISINAKVRAAVAVRHYEHAIHNAAEYLIELGDNIKISLVDIRDTELVKTENDRMVSIDTISKHMAPRTKRVITEVNKYRYFKTLGTRNKFKKFLTLPRNMTLDEVSEKLSISKSTSLLFRELRKRYEEDPDHDKKLFSPNL